MRISNSDTLNALTGKLPGVNLLKQNLKLLKQAALEKTGDLSNKISPPIDRFELSTREAATAASSLLKAPGNQVYSLSSILSNTRQSPLNRLQLAASQVLAKDFRAGGGFERGLIRTSSQTHDLGSSTKLNLSTKAEVSGGAEGNLELSNHRLLASASVGANASIGAEASVSTQLSEDISLTATASGSAQVQGGADASLELTEDKVAAGGSQTVGIGDSEATGGASVSVGPSIGAVFGGGFRYTEGTIAFGGEADLDLGIGLSVEGEASIDRAQLESGVEFVTDKASEAADTTVLLAGQAANASTQVANQALDLFTGGTQPSAEPTGFGGISPGIFMAVLFASQFASNQSGQSPVQEAFDALANVAENATGMAEDFVETVADASEEFVDTTLEAGQDLAESTIDLTEQTLDTTIELGSQAAETTIDYGIQATETTIEYGSQAAETTVKYGAQATETTIEYGSQAAEYTADKGTETITYVSEGLTNTGEGLQKAGDDFLGYIGFGKKKK